MKIPKLKEGLEHFVDAPIVQLALLKKFCELNNIKISDKKLMKIIEKENKIVRG